MHFSSGNVLHLQEGLASARGAGCVPAPQGKPGREDTDPRDPGRGVLMGHYRYSRTLELCEVLYKKKTQRADSCPVERGRPRRRYPPPPGPGLGGGRHSPPLPSQPPLTWGRRGGSSWRRQLSTRRFWTLSGAR